MEEWKMEFDGSCAQGTGGAGIILFNSKEKITLSYKLDFKCSNNEAEYEALILGMLEALRRGVKVLCIRGDSNLIVQQVNGEFSLKHANLAPYRYIIQRLLSQFLKVTVERHARTMNRHPDALATIAQKLDMDGPEATITVRRRIVPTTVKSLFPSEEPEDWRYLVVKQLETREGALKLVELANYHLLQGTLYFKSPGGFLARCVSKKEATERLLAMHEKHCGDTDIPLYRRLQRAGYYWPTMSTEAAHLQQGCLKCQTQFDQPVEANFIEDFDDWRQPYIAYLKNGELPTERGDEIYLRKRVARFYLVEGELYRKGYNEKALKCVAKGDVEKVLKEAHEPSHMGGAKLYDQLMTLGYYWPTMEADSIGHVKKCKACQVHGNMVHAPSVSLQSLSTPYPFHTWAFDLVGKISPASHGRAFIIVATELYTKWAEAIPLRRVTAQVVTQFLKEYIICRFGIPKVILTDNGKQFVCKEMALLMDKYKIMHKSSTISYPKGNGQAEATNKTLINILKKMLEDMPGAWDEKLPMVLWAYRTSKRKPTGFTPFSLVYGTEAVLPVELAVPSAIIALSHGLIPDPRHVQFEALDEHRDKARENFKVYTQQLSRAYENLVKPREFQVGDLVLRASTHHLRSMSASKFKPNWEGPFVVRGMGKSGYCQISEPESDCLQSINCKWLKRYYA